MGNVSFLPCFCFSRVPMTDVCVLWPRDDGYSKPTRWLWRHYVPRSPPFYCWLHCAVQRSVSMWTLKTVSNTGDLKGPCLGSVWPNTKPTDDRGKGFSLFFHFNTYTNFYFFVVNLVGLISFWWLRFPNTSCVRNTICCCGVPIGVYTPYIPYTLRNF